MSLPPGGTESKASLREHLEQVARTTGRRDERLDEPPVPPGTELLWRAFWAMYRGEVVAFAEMRAWSELTGEELTPWEAETLRVMSVAAVKEARDG